MRNMRSAVIAGAVALAAIIAAIVIVAVGNSNKGLYLTGSTGDVSVSNSDKGTSVPAEENMKLSQGDVVTVSEGGSCILSYRTSKNKQDTNYMVVLPESQVFVTDKFKGSSDSELYLNRGTVISSNSEDLGASANIRTANAGVGTACSVSVVSYVIDEEANYTEISSLGGNLYIQLYDDQGSAVNESEPLGPARKARVVSGKNGPYFAYLNENASPSDYTSEQLRQLFNISSYVNLEFTSEELKAAYDAIPREEKSADEPEDLDSVTTPSISEAHSIQTADTITTDTGTESDTDTETTVITSETTEYTTTTTVSETTADTEDTEEDTEEDTDTETEDTEEDTDTEYEETYDDSENDYDNDFESDIYTVYVVIDGVTTEQEVFAGMNAVQPADPVIEGKKFIGWDGSFNNITSDTTITALFEDSSSGDSSDTSSVSEASEPISCNVTFVVDGIKYFTTVNYGGTAAAPVTPGADSQGRSFVGWDRSLSNITGDTTITAVFESAPAVQKYTVTFIVDGVSYSQTVEAGSSAVAPPAPQVNSEGKQFLGWDTDYSNIQSDTTVVAVYG